MGLDVLGQVVGAHELLGALGALEALLARVRPAVSLELVRAGEPLAAEYPVADEGTLSVVPPEVGPEVRRLAVHLVAAGEVADVLLLSGLAVGVSGKSIKKDNVLEFNNKTQSNKSLFERPAAPDLRFDVFLNFC